MLTATGRASLQKTLSRSPVTWLFIAVNVAIYIIVSIQGQAFLGPADGSSILQNSVLVPFVTVQGEYWRIITSGFMHFGLMHVAFNMYALWVLGRDVEIALGSGRFAALYMASLLAGSASVLWFSPPNVATAGASGAIFGLMGAELIVLLRLKLKVTGFVTVLLLNVIMGFTLPGISIQAHLGGFAAGLIVAVAFVYVPQWMSKITKKPVIKKSVNLWGWGATLLVTIAIIIALWAGVDHIREVFLEMLQQLQLPGRPA
ncbi:MAG: rhomboid family intramembrane serine protease [Lawsonella sp.]